MATNAELRAAAECELDSWQSCYREPGTIEPGRVLMARHILSTVPADDAEPVTEEYVASLNPPRYWEAGREYSWPKVGLRYACELAGVSGVGEPGFYIDGRYEPLYLKHIKTRGQLHTLLTGLGIVLKGGA